MANNSIVVNDGYGDVTVAVDAWMENFQDNQVTLCVQTRIWGNATYGPWGFGIVGQSGYDGNGANWAEAGRGVFNYGAVVVDGICRWTVPRTETGWTASCWAKAWGEPVNGYSAYPNTHIEVRCDLWIDPAVRQPQGNPTVTISKTVANYGESVTVSWAKSATQGNAPFTRFELWQGSNLLYSGSGISKAVTPSDVTGAQGGNVTYTVKEIHTWAGVEYETSSSVSVEVRSGTVTVYNSQGTKCTGLVTVYNSQGDACYALITVYDDDGLPHNII